MYLELTEKLVKKCVRFSRSHSGILADYMCTYDTLLLIRWVHITKLSTILVEKRPTMAIRGGTGRDLRDTSEFGKKGLKKPTCPKLRLTNTGSPWISWPTLRTLYGTKLERHFPWACVQKCFLRSLWLKLISKSFIFLMICIIDLFTFFSKT